MKKKLSLVLVFIFSSMLFMNNPIIHADEVRSERTTGQITIMRGSSDNNSIGNQGGLDDKSSSEDQSNASLLPQTNESINYLLIVLGFVLLGGEVWYFKQKRKN